MNLKNNLQPMDTINNTEKLSNVQHEDIRGDIRWDPKKKTILDFEYYPTIYRLANYILWGGIITAIWALIRIFFDNDQTSSTIILTIIESGLYLYLTIIAYIALIKGKPNALFLARWVLFICLFSWVLSFLLALFFVIGNLDQIVNFYGILVVIWCVSGLIWLAIDPEIKEVFPKQFRKHTLRDWIIVLCVWLIPYLLGIILSFSTINENKSKSIQGVVDVINSGCPVETPWGGLLSFTDYNDDCLNFNFYVDEDRIKLSKLKENESLIKKFQIQSFQNAPSKSPLSNVTLSDLDVKLKYIIYNSKHSSDTINIIFSQDDLKNSVGKKPTPRGLVNSIVKIQNLLLPSQIEPGITCVEEKIIDNSLVFSYDVDEDVVDIDLKEKQKDFLQNRNYDMLSQNSEDEFIKSCRSCLHDFTYSFKGNKSGKKFEFSILMNSIKSNRNTSPKEKSPDEYLEEEVAKTKKSLPVIVEEGITLTDMYLTKYYVVAVYTVDEELYDMDLISLNKKEMQQERIKGLREKRKNNNETEKFINVLLETKRNFRDTYKGNKTKKTVDVDIITATI